jgi:hypothetical protein
MKNFYFLLLLSIFSSAARSQFVERVYLKDSVTTYTGWIVEQVPQDYVKMLRQKERDTIRIASDNIWKIVRVIDTKADDPFSTTEPTGRNQAIYVELGGSAYYYSFNYDTRFRKNRRDGWGARAGIGIFNLDIMDGSENKIGRATITAIPVQVNYLLGKKRGALELAAGVTPLFARLNFNTNAANSSFSFFNEEVRDFYLAPMGVVSYRFTSLNNGFMFRVSLQPSITYGEFYLGAAFSAGYHFAHKKKSSPAPQLKQ